MADQERKISAGDEFAEELGVLVSFLDPRLKAGGKTKSEARNEAKNPGTFAPWSARKCLFFFLFLATTSWLVLLAAVYLLSLIF